MFIRLFSSSSILDAHCVLFCSTIVQVRSRSSSTWPMKMIGKWRWTRESSINNWNNINEIEQRVKWDTKARREHWTARDLLLESPGRLFVGEHWCCQSTEIESTDSNSQTTNQSSPVAYSDDFAIRRSNLFGRHSPQSHPHPTAYASDEQNTDQDLRATWNGISTRSTEVLVFLSLSRDVHRLTFC